MPYKLRKAPKRNLYWVVNKDTGKKHSKDPLPKAKAQAQMKALYAVESGYKMRGRGNDGKEPPKPPTEAEMEAHRPQGPQVPMGRIENQPANFIQDLILLMRNYSRDTPIFRETKERVRMYFQLVIDLLREFRRMVDGFVDSSDQDRLVIAQTFQQSMAFFRRLLPQYQWVVPEAAVDAEDREYLERADDAATHMEGYLIDPLGELEEAVGMLMRFSDVEDTTEDILRIIDKTLQAYPLQNLASNNQGRWWSAMGVIGQGKMKGKGKELPEWTSALPAKWKKFLGYE